MNAVGNIRATIRLQPKGSPERPEFLTGVAVGHNYVSLQWTPGFDGGMQNTRFSVAYRQIVRSSSENDVENDCFIPRRSEQGGSSGSEEWIEFDCQRNNPCNVTMLEQYQAYTFKVSKGVVGSEKGRCVALSLRFSIICGWNMV